MTYILLRLILSATTGQPLEVSIVGEPYATYEDCGLARDAFGPQVPKEGRVAVYSCATEKQITKL